MNLIDALENISFTEYEAKIYLALLKEHPATGYQISKVSGVPRSMVYEVLSRLRSRGAVLETIEGRATLYRPLPPDLLLNQYQDHVQNLVTNLRPVLNQQYENHNDNRVWTISGSDAIYTYSIQMLQKAEKEVYLVANDVALEEIGSSLLNLAEKNIKPNLLLTGRKTIAFGDVVYHPPLESEIQGLTDTFLVLVDNNEVLVASINSDSRATVTTNPNLILIARQFVWMEFFTQRIYEKLGDDLLERLDPTDRKIFESIVIDD